MFALSDATFASKEVGSYSIRENAWLYIAVHALNNIKHFTVNWVWYERQTPSRQTESNAAAKSMNAQKSFFLRFFIISI
mgnify:CR=1 FL=1